MPKIASAWNAIVPGDIISFQYKSLISGESMKTHSIMVLNPKFPNTLKDGTTKFYVNGLKLEASNISIFTNKNQAWDLLRSIGWISIRNLRSEIYKVEINSRYIGAYGATDALFKKVMNTPIGKKAKFRTYNWEQARKNTVYYEPIKLPKDKIILLEQQRVANEN